MADLSQSRSVVECNVTPT